MPNAHAASYYRERIGDDTLRLSLEGRAHADVCVIGGGLAGLTTARELARRGRRVILLEGERIGWGASGRNAGFVSAGFSEGLDTLERRVGLDQARALYALSCAGVAYVRDTIVASGRQDIVSGRGKLKVLRHAGTGALKRSRDALAQKYGVEQAFWPREHLREVLRTPVYHGALFDPDAFHIDPLAYAQEVARCCEAAGGWIFEGSPVSRIARIGAGWRVETDIGVVHAETVVLATSAYGVLHHTYAPVDRAILPVATHVVVTEPLGARLAEAIRFPGCVADTRRCGDYFRVVAGGRLLWGGRITTRRSEPSRLADLLKADILKVFPQLGDVRIDHAWSGLMGYSVRKMPLVGPVRPGLWAATALGGHGLNTSATVADLVASGICDGDDRWRLFAPFAVRWGGGLIGRLATRFEYGRLRLADRIDERAARGAARA
ncbi:Putative oxidoreductase protein [Polymorphum gilvum SL003B-26A1]|uniref:Putative oxidoreductase protein n=1 Tax=Polymorphum gilvum (strain LMG 25793 / CGMCC 1.9160 / SL003B-26A1) TaxID=991905 RepID=F2J417_POLGS|nr:Putative oxidoreductase protein [Polymorphum gilvum SL003B-26A1]